MSRTLYIAAIACTPLSELDHDDREVEGLYLVEGIDASLSDGDAADTALASFHAHQGVSVLDDFEFVVLDPASQTALFPEHGEDRDEHDCVKLGDATEEWMTAPIADYARSLCSK